MKSGSFINGDCIFKVSAQVMVRQDLGWVPMGGGGLSQIELKRRSLPGESAEYSIEGITPSKSVNLRCTIHSNTKYDRPTPTFHIWSTNKERYGLTFETIGDAKHFDSAFKKIIRVLSQDTGINSPGETCDEEPSSIGRPELSSTGASYSTPGHSIRSAQSWDSSTYLRWLTLTNTEETLDASRWTDRRPTVTSAPCLFSLTQPPCNEPVPNPQGRLSGWLSRAWSRLRRHRPTQDHHQLTFSKARPSVSGPHERQSRDSYCPSISGSQSLGGSSSTGWRYRSPSNKQRSLVCVYCRRRFQQASNMHGNCSLARDPARQMVDKMSCIACARRLFQQVAGVEERNATFRLSCSNLCLDCASKDDVEEASEGNGGDAARPRNTCWRHWLAFLFVPCLVPCICCYWPYLACYKCCLHYKCVGGRHSSKLRT